MVYFTCNEIYKLKNIKKNFQEQKIANFKLSFVEQIFIKILYLEKNV